ncbi:hypothetical protein B4U80_11854 [Leptotrombidium deliense]|uniref:Uncharacterized protein n=1 Tax=Leptotrombidium deliense TaxID=299467 RepID=A0A443S1N9_9ACAR|nr:hypothetical protein B4U80_11854 [Leptotrombidium deliense]
MTIIAIVLDESGSMGICRDKTIEAFNKLLEEQKNESFLPKNDFAATKEDKVFLVTFNNAVKFLAEAVPISKVELLTRETYKPKNSTALNDAIMDTISRVCEYLQCNDASEKVVMAIFTDGEENMSTRYTNEQRNESIERMQQFANWKICYVGPEADEIRSKAKVKDSMIYSDGADPKESFDFMSSSISNHRKQKLEK